MNDLETTRSSASRRHAVEPSASDAGDSDFVRAIQWARSCADVAAFVEQHAADGEAFTFWCGFRLVVGAVEASPTEFATAKPGQLVALYGAPPSPVVRAADGFLLLKNCVLYISDEAVYDLAAVVDTLELPMPSALTRTPFQNNEDSNLWELRVTAWRYRGIDVEAAQEKWLQAGGRPSTDVTEPMRQNRDFVRYLMKRLNLKAGQQMVDVGCGDAWMTRLFREAGMEVTGLDILPTSIQAAQRMVPDGRFLVCDVFELDRHDDLKGAFDFVLCRDMGVAQKIVDWNEPRWVETGRAIVNLLRPGGSLYWIQMSNGSGRISLDGFSNTTADVLVAWFNRFGDIASVSAYGYISLVVTRRGEGEERRRALHQFDNGTASSVLHRHGAALERAASPSTDEAQEVRRAVTLRLSPLMLDLSAEERALGIVIGGIGRLAQICLAAARSMGIHVMAFLGPDDHAGSLLGTPIVPPRLASRLSPSTVVWTEGSRLTPFIRRQITLTGSAPNGEPQAFLISGDQDGRLEKSANRYDEKWDTPTVIEAVTFYDLSFTAPSSSQAASDDDDPPSEPGPPNWFAQRADSGSVSLLTGSDEDVRNPSRGRMVRGRYGGGTVFLSRRFFLEGENFRKALLGCWVRCDAHDCARVQLSDTLGDDPVVHAGDNLWRLLWVERTLAPECQWLDIYLQVVSEGEAWFLDPFLLCYGQA